MDFSLINKPVNEDAVVLSQIAEMEYVSCKAL